MATPRKMLRIVLNERPTGSITPGRTFRPESVDAPTEADLQDGQVLFESYYLSLDPAMRGWIEDKRSYLPPVQIGQVMRGACAGRILASKNPAFRAGDWATAFAGWAEVAVVDADWAWPAKSFAGLSLADHVGVLSTTGMTAYFGVKDICEPVRPGELAVVSGAAGATGSIAGQILKLKGARVVGVAGSDDKCRWLVDELGFDAALNYKDPEYKAKFVEATKDYVGVYWDNVGGETLDLALAQAKEFARFVACGKISTYNSNEPEVLYNLGALARMRIRMEGFIVLDKMARYPEACEEVARWVREGKVKPRNHIVKGGLANAEQGLLNMFSGKNFGKTIVEIKKAEGNDV